MTKRGNHDGNYRQLANGTWEGSVSLHGQRSYYYGKTKREAQRQLRAAVQAAEQGLAPAKSTTTLGAFLARWLADVAGPTLTARGYESYEYHCRCYLIPELGKVRLDRLQVAQLQAFYRRLLDRGLSPKTVNLIHGTLRAALQQAIQWGLISANVARLTRPPRVPRRQVRPLTVAEVRRLWATAPARWQALLLLTALTGGRQGEMLGLQWHDVDWERGTLTVGRQLQRDKTLREPKEDSRRTIDLTRVELETLREHYRRQCGLRERQGDRWEDHDLLFCTERGRPLGHRNVFREFKKILARAGLPDIHFHDLRHSSATILAEAGVPIKVIQERLGHRDIRTTLLFYGHVTPTMGKDAARRLDDLFGAAGE